MTFGALNFDCRTGRFRRKVDGLVGIMDAQIELYNKLPHSDYLRYHQMADIAHEHTFGKPCIGDGCEDVPCKRHARTMELAARLHRFRSNVRNEARSKTKGEL